MKMHSSLRRSGLLNGSLFALSISLFFAVFAGEWLAFLALLGGTVAVLIEGAGKASFDREIAK